MKECRTCSHVSKSIETGHLYCRRFPPQIVAIVEEMIERDPKDGKPMRKENGEFKTYIGTSGFKASFPRVEPDMGCSEHSSVLAVTAGQAADMGLKV